MGVLMAVALIMVGAFIGIGILAFFVVISEDAEREKENDRR